MSCIEYNYKLNGKEWQDDLGLNMYDLGARLYDPALARFTVIDPMTDFVNYQSPYVASDDNPVLYRDEYGLGIFNVIGNLFRRATNGVRRLFSGNNCDCGGREESISDSWRREDFPGLNRALSDLFSGSGKKSTKSNSSSSPSDPAFMGEKQYAVSIEKMTNELEIEVPEITRDVVYDVPERKQNPVINGREVKPGARISFNRNVVFDNSSTSLNNSSTDKILKDLLKTLVDYPQLTILISGNASFRTTSPVTSSTGVRVDGRNGTVGQLQLGRARAIEAYLIKNGIGSSRIRVATGQISTNGDSPSATFTIKN